MSESKIYDIILVRDLKREVFSFLDIADILSLRLLNTKFFESIEYDEIIWNNFALKYFGKNILDSIKGEEEEEEEEDSEDSEDDLVTSYLERFKKLTDECTCTRYSLMTPIPDDLFKVEEKMKERVKVCLSSRRYPFKTHLISPEKFIGEENHSKVPSSSLIFEHILRKPLSEEQLKILEVVCCYFSELVFCTYEEDSLCEGIRTSMESKYGVGSMTFLGDKEMKDVERKFEEQSFSQFQILNQFKEYTKEKAKKYDFENLEKILLSNHVEELIKKNRKNKNSVLHSVALDYQPEKNRLYSYWNFKFKDPISKLYKSASRKILVILPWYPIFQSMKKIFSFPSRILKKKSKKKVEILKLTIENRRKKGTGRKKKGLEFKMKWKTFLRNLEFRVLGDVGQYCQYDYSHVWFSNSAFYYAREYFGEVRSVIIRNDGNSQIVIDFNDSFPIFDHALLVDSSYTSSVISKTVEYLQNERKEDLKLEEEWEKELENKLDELRKIKEEEGEKE